MFTGIVQAVGQVRSVEGPKLVIAAPEEFGTGGYELGESVAVNGCCLTVIDSQGGLTFEVSPETFRRTSLGELSIGAPVNLERAMSANGRFGGHVVQGHVDATGEIASLTPQGEFTILRVQAPAEFDRYLIDKGSVTVDGISLTVVEPKDGAFDVWLVPHTLEHTNLHARKPGDRVNLEFDVIAKYVEKMLAPHLGNAAPKG